MYHEALRFALTCFNIALEITGDWDYHMRRGKALEKLNHNSEAVDAYCKAQFLGSDWLETHYRLFSSAQKLLLSGK